MQVCGINERRRDSLATTMHAFDFMISKKKAVTDGLAIIIRNKRELQEVVSYETRNK